LLTVFIIQLLFCISSLIIEEVGGGRGSCGYKEEKDEIKCCWGDVCGIEEE